MLLGLVACEGGSSGTLMGRVVDGFGNPLGGEAVMVTLTGNPAVNYPDRWGNFIIHAPTGDYTMRISFANPAAGYRYRLDEQVEVIHGSRQLGTFTLLNAQNMVAWIEYQSGDYDSAIRVFNTQANDARSGQVWLPYMRYIEGEENQNTLLTQGVLSAENGLGWCFSRGKGNHQEGKVHFDQSLFGGYNNYDACVGLAGIALGKGDAQTALDLLNKVIAEPGYYDSSQIHDDINEVDLIAAKSLAQFLLGEDTASKEAADSIAGKVAGEGNAGSNDLLIMLAKFR